MNRTDSQYLHHMRNILSKGEVKSNRTGVDTRSLFGHQMRFDLREGFPLLTTKKVHMKSIIHELLWFLKGESNIKYLTENGVTIWDEWADDKGNLGPVYGVQWRSWPAVNGESVEYIDQLQLRIDRLKTVPDCRRAIVSAWNVADLDDMALQPCHVLFQFNTAPMTFEQRLAVAKPYMDVNDYNAIKNGLVSRVEGETYMDEDGVPTHYLDTLLYQRSADWFLGVPFNIASYALLTQLIAQVVNMVPREFIHTFGDTHIYENHIDQCNTQLTRLKHTPLPIMKINPAVTEIDDFVYEDFELVGYESADAIKAPVAV